MAKAACVYILASKKHGTLYTGVTSNLEQRMYQHKHHLLEGFTSKYDVTRLVWFAQGEDIAAAIELEKKIKNRGRKWKIALIEKDNPEWVDLAAGWVDSATTLRSAQNDREGLGAAPNDREGLGAAPNDSEGADAAPKVGAAQNHGEGTA